MKDLFVIACVEDEADAAITLPWARYFAERLNHKELLALHVSSTGDTPGWLTRLGVPYVSLRGDWNTAIEGLPTVFHGILAVVACNPTAPRKSLIHPKTLLRAFKNCKIAYLCINSEFEVQSSEFEANNISEFRISNAALTMTHRHEGKEKLVWASYLARFLGSRITIASLNYKDAGLRQKLNNNLRFTDKIFKPLNISYQLSTLNSRLSTLNSADMEAIRQLAPDLLIARTSDPRERDLIDLLLPSLERKLLATGTPIIFLNPRDDLYILCD